MVGGTAAKICGKILITNKCSLTLHSKCLTAVYAKPSRVNLAWMDSDPCLRRICLWRSMILNVHTVASGKDLGKNPMNCSMAFSVLYRLEFK